MKINYLKKEINKSEVEKILNYTIIQIKRNIKVQMNCNLIFIKNSTSMAKFIHSSEERNRILKKILNHFNVKI